VRAKRLVQLITGVHRIHHIRFAFGWKMPLLQVAYFPPWSVRDLDQPSGRSPTYRFGWQRIKPTEFHDCTKTGRY
jgi:hypothetical protein